MIQIDFENAGKWAGDHRLPYTNFKSLVGLREVRDLIQKEVDTVNERFARVENVRKFLLLTRDWIMTMTR